jgi:hypothetical protein
MDLEQRLRSGDESGTEGERKERRWSGKSKKGVEMETNGKMRDERERSGDGLETDRNEMRWTGHRERQD